MQPCVKNRQMWFGLAVIDSKVGCPSNPNVC